VGPTESAETMAFYIQSMFIAVSLIIGILVGDGRYGWQSNPTLDFLLRAWTWPLLADLPLFALIGFAIGIGGFLISQGYRLAEASFAASFEYLALPLSVVWGMLFFAEYPDRLDYLGMFLILTAGVFAVWRDSKAGKG